MKKSIVLGLLLAFSSASFAGSCGFGGCGARSSCNTCCTVRYVQPVQRCCTMVKRTYYVPCCRTVRPKCGCSY